MKAIAWDCAAIGRVRVVQTNGKTKHWPYECGDRGHRAAVGLTPCGGKVWRQKGDTRQRRCWH